MRALYEKLYSVRPCATFEEFLERINSLYGPMTAFKTYDQSVTYSGLYRAVKDMIPRISESGARYQVTDEANPVKFCTAFLATVIAGKVAVLGMELPKTELGTHDADDGENARSGADECENAAGSKTGARSDECGAGGCDGVCVIARSSGTTSAAKPVMLSQKNLLTDMVGGMSLYEYPEGAVYYKVLPYSHLFGLVADMLGPLYSGGTICYSDNKLNFFKDLRHFRPTNMNLPPAMVYTIEKMLDEGMMARGVATRDGEAEAVATVTGGRLKKIMCAGAHINDATVKKLQNVGIAVYPAYGLTECSPCVSMCSELYYKPGSVGKILPCCDVKTVDGEIAVSGDTVMLGYAGDPETTSRVIRDGWLYTGDLGYVDEDGFLFLTGRKSDLIVFEDGTKILPEQLEEKLMRIPGIRECRVMKMTGTDRTRIKLTIVMDGASESGMASCEQDVDTTFRKHDPAPLEGDTACVDAAVRQCMEDEGLPARVGKIEYTTEALPRNAMGKVLRR